MASRNGNYQFLLRIISITSCRMVLLIATVWMLDVRYNQGKDLTNRPIINLSLAGHPASLKALAIVFLAFISVILF